MISSQSALCWLCLSAIVETGSVLSVSWVEWRASKRTWPDRESWPFDNPKALTARTASRSHESPGHHPRPEVVLTGALWCLLGRLPVALWYIVYSVLHVPSFFSVLKFFFLATVKSWIIKMNLLWRGWNVLICCLNFSQENAYICNLLNFFLATHVFSLDLKFFGRFMWMER